VACCQLVSGDQGINLDDFSKNIPALYHIAAVSVDVSLPTSSFFLLKTSRQTQDSWVPIWLCF